MSEPLSRAEISRRYRERNKDRIQERDRERVRAYYQKNREEILARLKRNYNADPEPRKEYARQAARKLRAEFLAAYGGRCECCGESEPAFLCLDHVNRDGVRDRAATGGRNTGVIRRLKREGWPRDGYRLLCANCNTATAWGRECPHQRKDLEDA